MKKISVASVPPIFELQASRENNEEGNVYCQGLTAKLHSRFGSLQNEKQASRLRRESLMPPIPSARSSASSSKTSSSRGNDGFYPYTPKEKDRDINMQENRLKIVGETGYIASNSRKKSTAEKLSDTGFHLYTLEDSNKLPKILKPKQKVGKGSKRKKIKNDQSTSSDESQGELSKNQLVDEQDGNKGNAQDTDEMYNKYGLDLRKEFNMEVTKPFTFSYFPQIYSRNKKGSKKETRKDKNNNIKPRPITRSRTGDGILSNKEESGSKHILFAIKMASTPASSEVDPEEDAGTIRFDTQKTGRAAEYPDFAIIWSFLENFRHLLHFPDLSLDDLEDGFNSHNSENGNVGIIEELFRKLLRRIGVSVNPEKWEKSLLKVAKEHGLVCAWDLEQFGYLELEVSSKLELFKALLEYQFDQNDKLKSSVNKSFDAEDLRMQPTGRDLDGFIYWYHEDDCNGVRLYTTEEDEVNCESWRLLAGETDELVAIVEFLESKSEVNPKEIALEKRREMKKKGEIKSPGKKKGKKGKKKENTEEEDYDDDNPCARCFSNVRPDSILLCDKCDAAYHTACLRPPLLTVPQGDWFCPFCQQLALLDVLKEKKTRIAARTKLRQRQAKRLGFAGIDLNNILQKASDDEEDQGIRRSGRSRKNVDYTFREFEEDITSAVERDKKRFKEEEVNGEQQGLLYSKPAYETGTLLGTGQRNTRRSRRLMDLDYESDSESRTSGFEYEGNSDEESQQPSIWHGSLRRKRRIINEDDEDDDGDVDVRNGNTKDLKVTETAQDGERSSVKEGEGSDKKADESVLDGKNDNGDKTEEKPDGEGETKAVVTTGATSSTSQSAVLFGNKIHPHSRIAAVAPVARNPPVANVKNYRTPPEYPPEGVFPNPPNFDMLKTQLPAKQTPSYPTSNFGESNIAAANLTGNPKNFTGAANLPPNSAPGAPQAGASFPGTQQGSHTRPHFGGPGLPDPISGGPSFPGANLNFTNTNFGGVSGRNFGGSFVGGMNNFGSGVGASFGGASNFGRNDATISSMGDFNAMKSPTHAQNVPGPLWGGQNDFNSMYNYQQFPQQSGTSSAPIPATKNQTLPPPYPSGAQFVGNRQYGGHNQHMPANSNMQSNYSSPQQSGNFPDPRYFPPSHQQPPPPYTANISQNANFYTNTSPEGGNLAGSQWTYPESYGYYPGQGSAAGRSF